MSILLLDLMGLVRRDNTPRSSTVVQASSLQNNEPVVLSSVVRKVLGGWRGSCGGILGQGLGLGEEECNGGFFWGGV